MLRVGSYNGVRGQFTTVQGAVNAARPGDVVLVGPGDYKTTAVHFPSGEQDFPAAVLITTGHVTLRGMNRGSVVIDGTKPGTPQCSNASADQNFGPSAGAGADTGVNGVEVYKSPADTVQNLTACNFLGGADDAGNAVWFNGGDNSGAIGGYGFDGSYLTTTSTFYGDERRRPSTASSPATGAVAAGIDHASNFNDSGFYIGACQQVCDQTLDHGWSEYNALGYSGTNSGGPLVIENSQFDNNEDGFDTNSQNADEPSPQNGACPPGVDPPVAGASTCWVFIHNYVHDNNNPNVPAAGSAAAGPVGTGMSLSGARNDTVIDNRFENNGAWGNDRRPLSRQRSALHGRDPDPGGVRLRRVRDRGDQQHLRHNGGFGNPTNGDIGAVNLEPGPTDCYSGNTDGRHAHNVARRAAADLPQCDGKTVPPNNNPVFLQQVACDSQSIQLAALAGGTLLSTGQQLPAPGAGQPMPPVPSGLPTMPDPCGGVRADPWCSGQVTTVARCVGRRVSTRLTLAVRERFTATDTRVAGHRSVHHVAKGGAGGCGSRSPSRSAATIAPESPSPST